MPKSLLPVVCAVLLCSHVKATGLLRIPSNYVSPLTYSAGLTALLKYGYATECVSPVSAAPSLSHAFASAYAAAPHFKHATASPPWNAYTAGAYAAPTAYTAASAYGTPTAYTAGYAALTALPSPLTYSAPASYASAPVITKYRAIAPWTSYAAPLGSW